MYFVIVGAGTVGASAASWLISTGHEVTLVDTDQTKVAAVEEELGSVLVTGDGTDVAVMARAGANRADVVLATTSRDYINLAVCQLCRHHFGVYRTISLVNSRDNVRLFGQLGINASIDVTELIVNRLQEELSDRTIVHLMPVSGVEGTGMVTFRIPDDGNANGRAMKDIPVPDGILIPLIISKDGNASVPKDDTVIHAGDNVVAITSSRYEEELKNLLVGGNGE